MKYIAVIFLFLLLTSTYGQVSTSIELADNHYSKWQVIIPKVFKNADKFYSYAFGKNFDNKIWSKIELKDSDKKLLQKSVVIHSEKFGYFIYNELYSLSGDWYIVQEDYYSDSGLLFLIDWKMNTFQADVPASVDKKIYFNPGGKIIKQTKEVFRMNTENKIDIGFADRNVDYNIRFANNDVVKKFGLFK